jgi:hypothetical protein
MKKRQKMKAMIEKKLKNKNRVMISSENFIFNLVVSKLYVMKFSKTFDIFSDFQ